jgi:hypothetical protein
LCFRQFLSFSMKQHHVRWAPCHHGMERPQVVVGRVRQMGWVWMNNCVQSEGLAGEGVHYAGLLEDTGVELLEWRSSPAAATPTSYLCLKIWLKDQTNWTVKHNLCYWMSNKPHITSDISKLQYTLKFTDNQRITDADICIFVCTFLHICLLSFRRWWCISKLYSPKSICKNSL